MAGLTTLTKKIASLEDELHAWTAKPERDIVSPTELKSALEKIDAKMLKAEENFQSLTEDRKQDARDLQDKLEALRKQLTLLISNHASSAQPGGGNANRNIQVAGVNVLRPFTDINFIAGANTTITTSANQTTKYTDITIASSGGGGGGDITIGTTTITGGTDTRILYNNAGVVGEYTLTGTGTVVVMADTPTLITPNIGVASGTSLTTTGALRSNTSLILEETGAGTDTVTIQVPASIAASYTLTLPVDDGNSGEVLSTDGSGVLSWVSNTTTATLVTVANEATDATCFPLFVTAATGDLGPKSNAGLTFNSNTASLGATLMTATTSLTSASILASSNDSGALGAAATAFSDLFLASGAVIGFANGNAVLTHSSGIITQTTGEFRITSANVGTNGDSVPTLSSTSTLTNKTLTSPAINTSTLGGHQTMLENAAFLADPVLSADGKYNGWVRAGTAGTTLAFGDLCYLDPTDSRWELTDANAAAAADGDSRGTLGICVLAAAADGDPTIMLRWGWVRADTAFPTFTVNNPVYISETAGDVTNTQPTTTDVVIRIIGAGETGDELFFNPDQTWITHT